MKRIYKVSIGFALSAFIFVVIAALIFLFYINPFQADGPFTGETREDCNLLENPVQVFPISSSNRLEVYERKEGDPAPIVLSRNRDDNIKWCVYAVANSFSEVHTIEFVSYGPWFFIGTKVEGIVNWTYGYEWTGWYITPFGRLRNYYYAW